MLQVWRGGNGLESFIGKLLGQEARQPVTKFHAGQFAGAALKISADKFQTVRF
jgi:hypothetical protein